MSAEAQSSQVPIGTILEGKFRVTQEIGRGGMAAVYEAVNVDIGKRVAVKILSAELISSRIVRERFIREARAAAAIISPYICEVYDSGMYHDRPFLVMELLDGESLYDRMTRIRQLKVSTALRIMRHVVRGLAKAHQASVVHRDLKPENIFLTRDTDGRMLAKIVDFGLAKFYESRDGTDDKSARLTREGALFGTPAYMSPEQAKGQGEVDHRADLWALGCIIYECLTGRTVWDVQQGVAMILAQIARGQLPDPLAYRPDLPESFSIWFKRALHPDLTQRYQSAREFLESLEDALASEDQPASSGPPSASRSSFHPEIPDPPYLSLAQNQEEAHQARGSGRAIAWLSVAAVFTLSAYTFWLYVLNPVAASSDATARGLTIAGDQERELKMAPMEEGPGAELINRGQAQLRADQHSEALQSFQDALGESPNIAQSLIRHANAATEEMGDCRLAGLGRPRPFSVDAPASHARILQSPDGILAIWTDTHQDPKRRNVYSALLDDSLRRIGQVKNVTPEATTAIYPTLAPLDHGFATLYWDSGPEEPGVYVRAIESDGRIRTPAVLLSAQEKDKYFPTLTLLPDGQLVSLWSEKSAETGRASIMLRKVDKTLEPVGKQVALTSLPEGDATQPHADVVGGTLHVAYRYFLAGQTSEIRMMRVPLASPEVAQGRLAEGRQGRSAGPSISLRSEPRQAEPSVSCDEAGCIVVWDDEGAGAFAGFIPAEGDAPLWHREFSTKGKRPIVARHHDGSAAIAYFAGDRLFLAPVSRDGVREPSVVSRVSGFQPPPTLIAGSTPGEWLIAWRDFEAGHLEVFVARAQCGPSEER